MVTVRKFKVRFKRKYPFKQIIIQCNNKPLEILAIKGDGVVERTFVLFTPLLKTIDQSIKRRDVGITARNSRVTRAPSMSSTDVNAVYRTHLQHTMKWFDQTVPIGVVVDEGIRQHVKDIFKIICIYFAKKETLCNVQNFPQRIESNSQNGKRTQRNFPCRCSRLLLTRKARCICKHGSAHLSF
jgi:hypothetical protein